MATKYSKGAQDKVEKAMHERKHGTLKSGGSGKTVTSRKQAIAIGLSEAREEGKKVPAKKTATKKAAPKKAPLQRKALRQKRPQRKKVRPPGKAHLLKKHPQRRVQPQRKQQLKSLPLKNNIPAPRPLHKKDHAWALVMPTRDFFCHS